jgi:GntR family transcriptional regulator
MVDPLYRRIADDLRVQIETGQLEPGSQLPPEEKLGELFKASRNTIRDAIKFLISLGLVETRAGQGTFVVDPPDPLVTTLTTDQPGLGGGEGAAYLSEASERNPRSDTPTVELQTALGEIAYRLGVKEGTPVVIRHERRFIRSKRANQPTALDSEETPWSMQTSYYPRRFALQGAERLLDNVDIKEGTVSYLKKTLHLEQVGYRDWITVRFSRSFVPRLIKTENRCESLSPYSRWTGSNSSLMLAMSPLRSSSPRSRRNDDAAISRATRAD